MNDRDEELDRLSDLLSGIPVERDGMSIGELDGYVAALIVCPEVILPSEWLTEVWGGEGAFADLCESGEIAEAVLGHYNRIARELAEDPEAYAPVFEVDSANGDMLWEPWISGFERAMRLRGDAWEKVALSDDEEAAASVNMILAMKAFDCGELKLTEQAEDEIDQAAPKLLPAFVRNLNTWTKIRGLHGRDVPQIGFSLEDPRSFGRKTGRNEPCPCGSGRKYKSCCGAN